MRYPAVKPSDARMYLSLLGTERAKDIEQFVRLRGEGTELDLAFVGALRSELSRIKAAFPDEISKKASAGANFERAAAEVVHRLIPSAPDVLTDPEFWTWLAVAHFKELIAWRYAAGEGAADARNYGIGSASENFLYRLWLRGEIGLDEAASDKYYLSRRGDVDFWRSHLFRQGYANARTFARALLKFQYPDGSSHEPRLKIAVVRELVKRLRRARANLVVELLDESMSLTLIQTELAALPIAGVDTSE